MQMISIKTKDIIVSIFFDMEGELIPSFEDKQVNKRYFQLL